MLNYIKSEWYRNFRNSNNYISLFGLIAVAALANIALGLYANGQVNFPYGNTKYAFSSIYAAMGVPFFLTLSVGSLAFGNEYNSRTLKNTIAFGLSRHKIYLGKLIVTWLIALVNMILISVTYVGFAYLMLENSGPEYLHELLFALLGGLPLLTVALVFSNCLHFKFESSWSVSGWWISIMVVVPQVLSMIGRGIPSVKVISQWMPWNILRLTNFDESMNRLILNWGNPEVLLKCLVVGIIGSTIFYVLGLKLFIRKEV